MLHFSEETTTVLRIIQLVTTPKPASAQCVSPSNSSQQSKPARPSLKFKPTEQTKPNYPKLYETIDIGALEKEVDQLDLYNHIAGYNAQSNTFYAYDLSSINHNDRQILDSQETVNRLFLLSGNLELNGSFIKTSPETVQAYKKRILNLQGPHPQALQDYQDPQKSLYAPNLLLLPIGLYNNSEVCEIVNLHCITYKILIALLKSLKETPQPNLKHKSNIVLFHKEHFFTP